MMTARRGDKRATIAMAHKPLRVIRAVLHMDKPYRDSGANVRAHAGGAERAAMAAQVEAVGFLEKQPTRHVAVAS